MDRYTKSSSSTSSESKSSFSSSEEEKRRRKSKKKLKGKKCDKSKDKKSHKKKKHRRRKSSSSSSEGSSEEEWVVKDKKATPTAPIPEPSSTSASSKSEKFGIGIDHPTQYIENDTDWIGVIPTFSNDSKRAKKRVEREQEKTLRSIDKPGLHARELNPYWKDGGTGLPSGNGQPEPEASEDPKQTLVGDGGLSWLRKSFLRAKQQADEQNISLEEIAEERWGSLDNFYQMLKKAEATAKSNTNSSKQSRHHGEPEKMNVRDKIQNPDYSDLNRNRDHERSRDRDGNRDRNSDRDRNRDRSSDRDRNRFRRRDRDRNRDRSCDRDRNRDRSRDRNRKCTNFPEDTRKWRGGAFKRPGRDSDSDNEKEPNTIGDRISSSSKLHPELANRQSNWKRKTIESPNVTTSEKADSPSQQQPKKMDIEEVVITTIAERREEAEMKVLTDTEMNALNAKILKAELIGNTGAVDELRKTLADATKMRDEFVTNSPANEPKVITKIVLKSDPRGVGRRLNNKPTETHKDGQRVRYFPDDDGQTLKKMFEKEKMNTVENENALFSRLMGRKGTKTTDEYDLDDEFADKASSSKKVQKEKEQEVRNIVNEEKRYMKTLEDCQWCFDGKELQKNIVISNGEKSFLCVPPFQSLTEGHCLIVPMYHTTCSTQLDEDVWEEMQKFRRSVVKMFLENDQDTVIFETAVFLKNHPHMYMECVPMPKETGELAPIYFKKAIQECETEWSQNKKLVDLRGRDVRRAVPKGLPYFSVDFGFDSGFAHVIEDERSFPKNFAQEIVGGMLELDHTTWRKQKRDDFKAQKEKVLGFLKMWGPHDWTKAN